MTYKPSGVCCSEITIEVDDKTSIIQSVSFKHGCSGNGLGISQLVKGMHVDEVIKRCDGIKCGFKNTSCPDQLAKALKEWRSSK